MKIKHTILINITLLSVLYFFIHNSASGNNGLNPGEPYGLKIEKQKDNAVVLLWNNSMAGALRINPPVITFKQGKDEKRIALKLLAHSCEQNKASFDYGIKIPNGKDGISGQYAIEIEIPGSGDYMSQRAKLSFEGKARQDISVESAFELPGNPAAAMVVEDLEITGGEDYTKPDRVLYTRGIQAHALKDGKKRAAYFEMGLNSTEKNGKRISMPVVGFAFRPDSLGQAPLMLAVSSDPYSGTQFYGKSSKRGTHISIVNRYDGSVVPVCLTRHADSAIDYAERRSRRRLEEPVVLIVPVTDKIRDKLRRVLWHPVVDELYEGEFFIHRVGHGSIEYERKKLQEAIDRVFEI